MAAELSRGFRTTWNAEAPSIKRT